MTNSIQQQAQQLKEEYDAKQRELITTLQQQNDQKIAMLADEINKAKAEQQQAMQAQIAQLQASMQAQQAVEQAKKIKPSLAVKTPAGKRAVTVMIESLAAVGGLLNPGDVVDIIAHLSVPGGASGERAEKKSLVTAMIFQSLEVLAVNTNLDETGVYYDDQQSASALKVTFAVEPDEAGLLSFASKNGKLELALRAPDERDRQMVKASTWKTLADYVLENDGAEINLPRDLRETPSDDKPVEDKPSIQIFRGGKEL